MQVNLQKTFPIGASPEAAWQLLQNIPEVAACMPGARITEQIDETHYKGQVGVKLGPATATFKGDVEVKGTDAARRELQLTGKGMDTRGTSTASMDLSVGIQDAGDGQAQLIGDATVTVTGKLASFGARMMTQVADQLLNQFVVNFSNRVLAMGEGAAAEAAAAKVAGQPQEISALALVWQAIIGFIKGLFGHKPKASG